VVKIKSYLKILRVEKMSKQHERRLKILNDPESQKEQIFTKPEYLREFANLINSKMNEDDCFVDCSCGTGELGVLLAQMGRSVIMFDIDETFLLEEARPFFKLKDWLETTTDDIPAAKGYVIGFNPPYGHHKKIAKQFIRHAAGLFDSGKCHTMVFLTFYLGDGWSPPNFSVTSSSSYQFHSLFYDPLDNDRKFHLNMGVVFNVFEWGKSSSSHSSSPRLPSDWDVRRLPCDRQNPRKEFSVMQTLESKYGNGRVLLLRSVGGDAGQTARWWDSHCKKYVYFNMNGREKHELPENTLATSCYTIVVCPSYLAHEKRRLVVSKLNPVLFNLRQEKGRKHGVSVKEITWAINQIEWK